MKRKLICCTLSLGLVVALSGLSFARPSGEVKSSPLFQQSLEQSIAKLEGNAVQSQGQQGSSADLPTGQHICPLLPNTQAQTCSPTYCGGETCGSTCGGSYTCWATCASTCNTCEGQPTCGSYPTCGNTCNSTCLGVVCFHFSGHAYWYYYGYAGSDWGYNGLGYYFGIVPINISVYVDYGDGVRNSGGIGINYANSYYDGVDSRSAYSGTYYLDGGGWVYSDENPDEPWLASGQTGSRSLQADNINDFYINVAPN